MRGAARSPIRGRVNLLARSLAQGLNALRSTASTGAENRVETAFKTIEAYELLSRDVYRLRAHRQATGEPATALREAEELLAATASELLTIARGSRRTESAYGLFIREYRRLWRKHIGLFLFTASIFIASTLLGWSIGVHEPDYVTLIAGQGMVEAIHDHKPWFESIQQSPILQGLAIAWNNIRVSLIAFSLGAMLGIGGLVILGYNGLLFGCIFGYCRANGFDDALLGFVVSHGPLELTIIIASSFTGVLIGRAFYTRPVAKMRSRLAVAAREAATLTVGVVPWLVVAAAFECFVSPFPYLSFSVKATLGLLIAGLFWLWTFYPQASRELRKSS